MQISNPTSQAIQAALIQAVEQISNDDDFEVITDLHLMLDTDTGILTIITDDDTQVATADIDEWIDLDPDEDMPQVVQTLSTILHQLAAQGAFSHTHIARPFSFVLEDTDHETISELYVVGDSDDDTLYIPGSLLQGMDEDLDNFLEHLMKE